MHYPYKLILASKSPRRQLLLKEIGFKFKIKTKEVDESFSKKLKGKQIALYLCKKKALAFVNELKANELLITADTIVCIHKKVLNKPANHKEAVNMLKLLSGKTHTVFTGVCLTLKKTDGIQSTVFAVATKVKFHKLSKEEIDFYIHTYKPFDKAGSYGAQECLPAGANPCSLEEKRFLKKIKKPDLYIKTSMQKKEEKHVRIIQKISGSYFNVMGLPIKDLHEHLIKIKKGPSFR